MNLFINPAAVRKHSTAIVLLGVANLLIGFFAIVFSGMTTLLSVTTLGFILVFAGTSEIVFGIKTRKEGNLFFHLAMGAFAIAIGVMLLNNPVGNAIAITMLIGALFMVSGSVRVVGSLVERFPNWGWVAFSGLVSSVLGVLILNQLPSSALWVIGMLVGFEILTFGMSMLRIGLAGRAISDRVEAVRPLRTVNS